MKNIKELWLISQEEIVSSVKCGNQNENAEKKALRSMGVPLLVGILYFATGIALLVYNIMKYKSIKSIEPQLVVGSIELIILGFYTLLYVLISHGEIYGWKRKKVKAAVITLMIPYHICIKRVKAIIRDSKQEHVSYLVPYYLISLVLVVITFGLLVNIVARLGLDEGYNWIIGLVIDIVLIKEFFVFAKGFAYLLTRQLICSEQKYKIKATSKTNWRESYRNGDHKKERDDRLKLEWGIVTFELEYSKLYFYVILTLLVLCMPKESGTISELLSDQFMGITTVAALIREAKKEICEAEDENRKEK